MLKPENIGLDLLGIGVINISPNLAAKLSYHHSVGVYVSGLLPNSPAKEAGIAQGDIITAISDWAVHNTISMKEIMACLHPGDVVTVTIWRGGKTNQLALLT